MSAEQMVLEPQNIVLVVGLILVFLVAYKLLKMVIEVLMMAVMSGFFYFLLTVYIFPGSFGFSKLLFFVLLGPILYMAYYTLFVSLDLGKKLVKIPLGMFSWLINTFREEQDYKARKKKKRSESKTKEFILESQKDRKE